MDELQKGIEDISLDKPYKRMLMVILSSEKAKGLLSSEKCKERIKEVVQELQFKTSNCDFLSVYYYNCESIEDYGWGCAWRAIQTTLSFFKNCLKESNKELNEFDLSFHNLFISFGKRDTLEKLYLKAYNCTNNQEIPSFLKEKEFAPWETNNGWAEPFIGKLIFSHFNLKGELLLLHQWPMYAFAPQEVFNRCLSFEDFISLLSKHFDNKNASPIIIDDSVCTLCVNGIFINKETKATHLLVLDPHVKVNEIGETGIYQVILSEKGEFIKEANPQPTILGARLDFSKKGWMIFIPDLIDN